MHHILICYSCDTCTGYNYWLSSDLGPRAAGLEGKGTTVIDVITVPRQHQHNFLGPKKAPTVAGIIFSGAYKKACFKTSRQSFCIFDFLHF